MTLISTSPTESLLTGIAPMNPPSRQVSKPRVYQRQQIIPASRRRSSRIRLKPPSTYIPPTSTTPCPRLPASDPIEISVQEYLGEHPAQTPINRTRKRKFDQTFNTGVDRPAQRARLTRKNLEEFDIMREQRQSGPGGKRTLAQLSSAAKTSEQDAASRGRRKSKLSFSDTKSTRSKQTSSTTNSNFVDVAYENGILNPLCSKPPANMASRSERLNQSRDTASPTESEYHDFASAIKRAPNEQSVLVETSRLLKRYSESGYQRTYDQALTSFPKNVGFNDDLSAAQPDMIEGLDMPELEPFPVRQQLGGAATLYSGTHATTLPHLAGEWKGPGKDMILAQTQAAYDGACMVYGRNKAKAYLENPDPPGHAFVSTFTCDGNILNTFTHYSSESQGQLKYHQYPESNTLLVATYADFKTSRRRLRNLQDDAKEASESLRNDLIEKWSSDQRLDEDVDDQSSKYVSVPQSTNSHGSNDEITPDSQLLTEDWTTFSTQQVSLSGVDNDECVLPAPAGDEGSTSLLSPLTPPHSSTDVGSKGKGKGKNKGRGLSAPGGSKRVSGVCT